MAERAFVYIDGLNFYYGLVKNTRYKWLDFSKLMRKVLPTNFDILKIKYFTTIVKPFPNDLQAPQRQMFFIRALEKVDKNLEIFYGSFLVNPKWRYLKSPIIDSTGQTISKVRVMEPEEKGSDVNLAIHLLNDSWLNLFDWAVVVSNDSDLAESLRLVKTQCNKKILLIPTISSIGSNVMKKPSSKLLNYANKVIKIRESSLRNSQLPTNIPGTNIRKPNNW